MGDIDETLGMKRLTADNWRTPDPTAQGTGYLSELAGPIVPDGDGWARLFLAVELDADVPSDIRALFAVARGCMAYGWLFYPLYALGDQHTFRVLEAATARCCTDAGGDPRLRYRDRLLWLDRHSILPPGELARWDAARHLRNSASHPSHAAATAPGTVLDHLKQSAWDINAIFRRLSRRASLA